MNVKLAWNNMCLQTGSNTSSLPLLISWNAIVLQLACYYYCNSFLAANQRAFVFLVYHFLSFLPTSIQSKKRPKPPSGISYFFLNHKFVFINQYSDYSHNSKVKDEKSCKFARPSLLISDGESSTYCELVKRLQSLNFSLQQQFSTLCFLFKKL